MLSSVIKIGVLILISMSSCVYAEQSCTSDECTEVCTYWWWWLPNWCRNRCDECFYMNSAVCDSGCSYWLYSYCHQCGTTEHVTYPEPSNVPDLESSGSSFSTDEEYNTPTMVDEAKGHTDEGEGINENKTTTPTTVDEDKWNINEGVEIDENMTITPTTVENDDEFKGNDGNEAEKVSDNGDNSTAVKAAIGSIIPIIILIFVAIMIWYFTNKKSRKMTKPQSVSYKVDNISYGTADEIHSKDISENNRVDIAVYDDSEYNTLHDTTTETHEYAYAGYPGDGQYQSKPTVYSEVSKDSPEYYTLQKEQESDVTESSSDVKVTPIDTDTLKQNGSQSEYMCLQHDASTTTNTPPPATQNEDDAEYAYVSYPEDCRDQSKPTEYAKVSNDLPEYYTPKKDKDSDVTILNITSLQNDDAYDELRLDGNDSNDNSYNKLNHLARINVPDDITDDYNKLIPTPAFDEESEEYSHINRTLKTDESVTDHGYGKLELPTEPTAGSIKPAAKANDGYEETLPNLPFHFISNHIYFFLSKKTFDNNNNNSR